MQREHYDKGQMILDARALYHDSSLADLYDEGVMPPELRTAHQKNDRAVMEAYGFWGKLPSSDLQKSIKNSFSKNFFQALWDNGSTAFFVCRNGERCLTFGLFFLD
jgi:hypothetical protein